MKTKNNRGKTNLFETIRARLSENKIIQRPNQRNSKHSEPFSIDEPLVPDSEPNLNIHYITDMHLSQNINLWNFENTASIEAAIDSIIISLYSGTDLRKNLPTKKPSNMLLFGGDIASNFDLFAQFVKRLKRFVNISCTPIVFVLGNHELRAAGKLEYEDIVAKYETLLRENGMYLLHNNIIYMNNEGILKKVSSEHINPNKFDCVKTQLDQAKMIMVGGTGFSAQCETFNAESGVYADILTKEQDACLTRKFDDLYNNTCSLLSDKKVIVFTHMPLSDWHVNDDRQPGFIYINGHTHRNYFEDNGLFQVYADNQVGYDKNQTNLRRAMRNEKNFKLKNFYLNNECNKQN